MTDLAGIAAVVTGGAGGIGRAIVRRLAADGAKVAVADVDERGARAAAEEAVQKGGEAFAALTDVSSVTDVEHLMQRTVERFARLDVLVNCAAITRCYVDLLDIEPEEWQRVIDVNLSGAFLCSQRAARRMRADGGGRIVNIGSVGAIMPEPRAAHYCAAKGGLDALTRALARELAPYNVLVNVVHPGAICVEPSPTAGASFDPARDGTPIAKIPLSRFGEVEEIAGVVAFLSSRDASYIQGASIVVDGGYLLT
jgi:NAD(P)-dependent dehydrogenase (short-subunit alcohol dehydrogenase family)